ncbi:MAG: thioesterase, partial [Thermoleophilia bacterium]|nr:thioesterase [Gaiellaceae bacterium]MDW8339523.1 thioesterase [Thermoleophilia bacterium]
LDAIARFLQDVATDDVDETGWGAPNHLWVVRSLRIDVLAPPVEDREVELLTWCSGTGTVVAGRRMSLLGDRGGRVEADSVWIHLDRRGRPARIDDFDVYAGSTEGRVVTTKLELPEPERRRGRFPWHVRVADLDRMGHVNNAVYLAAVEECLARGGPDPRRPLRVRVDYRQPIDLGDEVELEVEAADDLLAVAFRVRGETRAVARVEPAEGG